MDMGVAMGKRTSPGNDGIRRDGRQRVHAEATRISWSPPPANWRPPSRKSDCTKRPRRAYEDLRRTQEQLLQSEKMSAVGQLISGVAHELNNPLTAILGYAQLLESEGLSSRAADFVAKFFARRSVPIAWCKTCYRLPGSASRTQTRGCAQGAGGNAGAARIRSESQRNQVGARDRVGSARRSSADPHQLEQVFLNIINNALDAMWRRARAARCGCASMRKTAKCMSSSRTPDRASKNPTNFRTFLHDQKRG